MTKEHSSTLIGNFLNAGSARDEGVAPIILSVGSTTVPLAAVETLFRRMQQDSQFPEIDSIEKTINQIISKTRVTVEHAIARVKSCRIVADTFRSWWRRLADEVMLATSRL